MVLREVLAPFLLYFSCFIQSLGEWEALVASLSRLIREVGRLSPPVIPELYGRLGGSHRLLYPVFGRVIPVILTVCDRKSWFLGPQPGV